MAYRPQQSRRRQNEPPNKGGLQDCHELELHPLYTEFIKRYMFNLPLFAYEVCGCTYVDKDNNDEITEQQKELLESVQMPASMTAVASGHGTGKTRSIAIICLWHLLCFPQSNTLVTAPKVDQVRSHVWKEIHAAVERMRGGTWGWMADFIEIWSRRVNIRGHAAKWFVKAKSAPKGAPENIAGEHAHFYLVIADEASGVDDEILKKLDSALTQGAGNRMLLISQPTRNTGYFYEAHQKRNKLCGGHWTAITMNGEDSRLVTDAMIARKQMEYGGRESREYCISVRGIFPDFNNGYLVAAPDFAATFTKKNIIPRNAPYGQIITVDLASGEGRDYTVMTLFSVLGSGDIGRNARRVTLEKVLMYNNTLKGSKGAGQIKRIKDMYPHARMYVDAGGLGLTICQLLEEWKVPLTRVNWGLTSYNPSYKERFQDQRAQCHSHLARAIENGRFTIKDYRYKQELTNEATRIPFGFNSRGVFKIPSKKDMRELGIKSPDMWDTLAMAFLEFANYDVFNALSSKEGKKTAVTKASKKMDKVVDEYL